ncbi:MAG: SPFH domain-containing protein [Candidatus Adiutrix sp.]|nr:SPFH domain-containing protein [Candidatus Adiutrix sp.]
MAIVEVVKYNGGADVFAWKYPEEELGTWTQLIVNESQQAVLFKGGQALDILGPGRHTLSTANIPILSHLVNLPFDGRSPFTAEVWYVSRLHALDIKWGTPTPIQIQDPKYGIFAPVRSFGQFGIKVEQADRFLIKLVGAMPLFDRDHLQKYFRGLYLTKAKDAISSYLVHKKISLLEINAYLDELSEHMKRRIEPVLADYGITLVNFFVNDINVPEGDPAVSQLKAALAKRAEMNIIGYSYQQERSFDTLEGAATNPGTASSGLMGAGLGLGMGVGLGGAVGNHFSGLAQNLNPGPVAAEAVCPQCRAAVPAGKRFCPDCGQALGSAGPGVKCDKCGAELKPGVKFCPDCGDAYNPCPKCGADLPEGADRCGACGQVLGKPCPQCGLALGDQAARFCPDCGASLVRVCPACQEDLTAEAKFCPKCGQRL